MLREEALIATLGVSPQIVTISLDLLAKKRVRIAEVVSIYTANPRVQTALRQLDDELRRMDGPPHRPVLIGGPDRPVSDFLTETDAARLLRTLYREIKDQKRANRRIHLLIAGGRRVMSAYALVVAQLLFDEHDRCWHLFSDFWQKERDRKMHIEPGDHAVLVPVPVLRWTPMSTVAADLALIDDPLEVLNRQQELQQREHDLRVRAFLRGLSPAQQEIARLLAVGLDNKAIAARRGKSINTVTKQISVIYQQWRNFFNTPADAPVRDRIVAELSGYYVRNRDEAQRKK